ncbi:MAG: NlpC/P60 family protein [Oscillospiraceae bacterium]
MSQPDKRQTGDGSDNYGHAARQMASAVKQSGQQAAKQAAAKGAEASANAAAAAVQAGAEGGKAAAQIAAGTAAGGPWGAVLSAAWAARHTLFKVLICVCLFMVFNTVILTSLPSILLNSLSEADGTQAGGNALGSAYESLASSVTGVVDEGYNLSLEQVKKIIEDGGYDYNTSMEELNDSAKVSADYDVSYILAAYSASMKQQNTGRDDMIAKLKTAAGSMFPVSYEEKEKTRTVPVSYQAYREVTVTEVTEVVHTGNINGLPQYRYETQTAAYYIPDEEVTSNTAVTVNKYEETMVSTAVYTGDEVTGIKTEYYYRPSGTETLTPETGTVKYAECTIHPFDNTVVIKAFGIDLSAPYDEFSITYGQAIQNMADSLKKTLYGAAAKGQPVPLTDAELSAFVSRQSCSAVRKHILSTALSLVGKVPYFWGGKSDAGWNDLWNTPKLVTAGGSSSSGTILPYGLDCSGFTDWTYKTAAGVSLYAGTHSQWDNSFPITEDELLPGDLGFLMNEDGADWNHVLIYAGLSESGEKMWVHCTGGSGVVLNTPSYASSLSLRRPKDVDFDADIIKKEGDFIG